MNIEYIIVILWPFWTEKYPWINHNWLIKSKFTLESSMKFSDLISNGYAICIFLNLILISAGLPVDSLV